jgi:hypothetical protein
LASSSALHGVLMRTLGIRALKITKKYLFNFNLELHVGVDGAFNIGFALFFE